MPKKKKTYYFIMPKKKNHITYAKEFKNNINHPR